MASPFDDLMQTGLSAVSPIVAPVMQQAAPVMTQAAPVLTEAAAPVVNPLAEQAGEAFGRGASKTFDPLASLTSVKERIPGGWLGLGAIVAVGTVLLSAVPRMLGGRR
jgi:hypothetical protein